MTKLKSVLLKTFMNNFFLKFLLPTMNTFHLKTIKNQVLNKNQH